YNNQLTSLPESLGNLANLRDFRVESNPLADFPPEIVSLGSNAILKYLKGLDTKVPHWASKMLVVGEGGVGKTNVIRRLKGEEFDPAQGTTRGVAIRELPLAHPKRKDVTMMLNVWDFAGQEIEHATHQFFLTQRSLFLLIWNARHGYEQGKLLHWLETIRTRAGDKVPIVIVATHSDMRRADLPLAEIQRKYPQVEGAYTVSNKSGVGFSKLRAAIQRLCACDKMPLMGEPIPERWKRAMEGVRKLPSRTLWMTHDALLDKLATYSLTGDTAKIVTSWMHDSGDLLHFRENKELQDIVILQPQWVTRHIALVLDSRRVQKENGVFTTEEMLTLWSRVDAEVRELFLNLMEQFDLSYRIPDDPEYKSLVIECVPPDEADYSAVWEASLTKEYCREVTLHYKLSAIPAGIPTWFIARSHRFTQNLHWKRGALFGDDRKAPQHFALITASEEDKRVEITVRGASPESFLSLMVQGMEVTLARFRGLKIDRFIPCHCERGCTETYEMGTLVKHHSDGIEAIDCYKTRKRVVIQELLFGRTVWSNKPRYDHETKAPQQIAAPIYGVAEWDEERLAKEEKTQTAPLITRHILLQSNPAHFAEDSAYSCPNLILVRPQEAKNIKEHLSAIAYESLELVLFCQEDDEWHGVKAYPLKEPTKAFLRALPAMQKFAIWLKRAVPFLSPATGLYDAALGEQFKWYFKMLEESAKLIPDPESPRARPIESYRGNHPLQVERADIEELYKLLEELEPNHTAEDWGGLQRVVTPEKQCLWLCPKHAKRYERYQRP
ncbi:MAG: hypothetical protein NT023_00405, partial [Armatimonadetes bacterium]|nr:hypothetical protein [Armatimonadota bacterium]